MKMFWALLTMLAGVALILVLVPGQGRSAGIDQAVEIETSPADSASEIEAPAPPGASAVPVESAPESDSTAPADSRDAPSSEPESRIIEHPEFGQIVAARRKPLDDGFTLYDDRFKVRGSGSAEDPFEIPWELLISASDSYQPRRGKKKLPERVTMLHEQHVRVTGYVAFPIVATTQSELLAMRNMWDGCCVGMPPTAYDAIEVRLAQAATGESRFTAFGTVEGLFKVDPYVRGNWLLGLYLMEEAKLMPSGDMRTDPSQHDGDAGAGGLPAGFP